MTSRAPGLKTHSGVIRRSRGSAGDYLLGIIVPGLLLPLPLHAATRFGADLRWVSAYVLLLSAITFWLYARDKRQACAGEWRVPEVRLHLLELLGGWPGAFLAQRVLRHKSSKGSYQFVFVLIVLGQQFLAYDSLQNWRLCRAAFDRPTQSSKGRL